MGEGTFGRVLECWDREAKEFVAVKIIRSIQKYRDAAMILSVLSKHDKSSSRCVQIRNLYNGGTHDAQLQVQILTSSAGLGLERAPPPPPLPCAYGGQKGPAVQRGISPPRREDDKDGHYVFELGENLTPRYKILSEMGEGHACLPR